MNFLDLMVRQGTIDNPPKPPLVPGFECCGIVESVGENTKGFEVSEITGLLCSVEQNLHKKKKKKSMKTYSLSTISLSCHAFFHITLSSCYVNVFLSDRWQGYGFCELQCLGRGRLHTSGFRLQDARRNDFCGGGGVLPELCGCLYDALWSCQSAWRDVCVSPRSRRCRSKYVFFVSPFHRLQ